MASARSRRQFSGEDFIEIVRCLVLVTFNHDSERFYQFSLQLRYQTQRTLSVVSIDTAMSYGCIYGWRVRATGDVGGEKEDFREMDYL